MIEKYLITVANRIGKGTIRRITGQLVIGIGCTGPELMAPTIARYFSVIIVGR